MNRFICFPGRDLVINVLFVKDNIQKVAKGEKTLSQALKDIATFMIAGSKIVILP